jgi:hypothetical protein
MSVGEKTVGVMTVGVMTVVVMTIGVMRRPPLLTVGQKHTRVLQNASD